MEVSAKTRLNVNSYMLKKFKKKNVKAYQLIKKMLEVVYELYLIEHDINFFRTTEIIKLAKIDGYYSNITVAIRKLLKEEGFETDIKVFLISAVEEIIDKTENGLEEF